MQDGSVPVWSQRLVSFSSIAPENGWLPSLADFDNHSAFLIRLTEIDFVLKNHGRARVHAFQLAGSPFEFKELFTIPRFHCQQMVTHPCENDRLAMHLDDAQRGVTG